MALSDAELAKLYRAEHESTKRDLAKTVELLAYYRELAPGSYDRSMPPAHYFVAPTKGWSYGMVRDGRLKMLGADRGSEHAAVEACWEHFDTLHSHRVEAHIQRTRPAKAQSKIGTEEDNHELDLSLDDDEPTPPPQPTRRRRRRIVND